MAGTQDYNCGQQRFLAFAIGLVDLLSITVNGEAREVPANLRVSELLSHLNLGLDRVAVELNRTLIRKRDWAQTPVPAGAQVEIVEFVGGG